MFAIIFAAFTLSGWAVDSPLQKGKKPDAQLASQQAWLRLNNIQNLGQIQLVQQGGKDAPLQAQMAKIKSALEKAGVNEQVSVFFSDLEGNLFSNLGSYKPDKMGVKRQVPATGNSSSGQAHQPTAFSSMPPLQPLHSPGNDLPPGNRGVKMKPGAILHSKVVFKDGMGAIKATLQVQISVPNVPVTTKGKKKNKG